jgi:hypothetical protein
MRVELVSVRATDSEATYTVRVLAVELHVHYDQIAKSLNLLSRSTSTSNWFFLCAPTWYKIVESCLSPSQVSLSLCIKHGLGSALNH